MIDFETGPCLSDAGVAQKGIQAEERFEDEDEASFMRLRSHSSEKDPKLGETIPVLVEVGKNTRSAAGNSTIITICGM